MVQTSFVEPRSLPTVTASGPQGFAHVNRLDSRQFGVQALDFLGPPLVVEPSQLQRGGAQIADMDRPSDDGEVPLPKQGFDPMIGMFAIARASEIS